MVTTQKLLFRSLFWLSQFIIISCLPQEDIPNVRAIEKAFDIFTGASSAFQHFLPEPKLQGQEPATNPQEQDDPQRLPATTTTEQCVSDPRSVANPSSTCKEPAHKVIIYSVSCAATADNDFITQTIISFVGLEGYHASLDRLCGVSFWATSLTLDQIQSIRKLKGVRGVTPDGEVIDVGFRDRQERTQSDSFRKNNQAEKKKKKRIYKRDTVISRSNEEKDLAFLSTAKHWELKPRYYYFGNAGRGTMIYHVSFGVEENDPEFIAHSNIQRWLYGMDTIPYKTDDSAHATGTCALSKSIGDTFGVANLAWATEVKVAHSISSLLSGMQEAINDLDSKPIETVAGWTVLETALGWEFDDPDVQNSDLNVEHLRQMLFILSTKYQVLVVVPAGNHYANEDRYRGISRVPALYSLDGTLSVMTVGAVDQATGLPLAWSGEGMALTVSAPGSGRCSGRDGNSDLYGGTNLASSIVAGLALYFLSLDDVGPQIRAEENIPQALRRYILSKAYARPGTAVKSVSNGINPNDPDNYGWIP